MPDQRSQATAASLRGLRSDASVDQTTQNLLRAMTLILELQSRYRVFEFEADQDGHADTAALFRELRAVSKQQTTELMADLHRHLGEGLRQAGDGFQ